MFPDYNTLYITFIALLVGLVLLFWHKGLSRLIAHKIKPDRGQFLSKLDEVLFIAGVVIVTMCVLWLIRVLGE